MTTCELDSEGALRNRGLLKRFPQDDTAAYYGASPRNKRVYDKLWVAKSQGLQAGRMSELPRRYPVVVKPRVSLMGFGVGMSIARDQADFFGRSAGADADELMWMEFLSGPQFSVDLVVRQGEIQTYRATQGIPGDGEQRATFKWWESVPNYWLPERVAGWIRRHLKHYTGPVNVEIIDGRIIECHLRLGEDTFALDPEFWQCLSGSRCDESAQSQRKVYFFPVFRREGAGELTAHEERVMRGGAADACRQDQSELYKVNGQQRYAVFTSNSLEEGLRLQRRLQKSESNTFVVVVLAVILFLWLMRK